MSSPSLRKTVDGSEQPIEQNAAHSKIWGDCYAHLDRALGKYDLLDTLPSTSWFGSSKQSYQEDIDRIIASVILLLRTSDAVSSREELAASSKANR